MYAVVAVGLRRAAAAVRVFAALPVSTPPLQASRLLFADLVRTGSIS